MQAGDPERATLLLGRPPELEGEVVHGAGRGRSIGVPTANLRCTTEVLPAVGVYAAWAELLAPEAPAEAAAAAAGDAPEIAQPRRVVLRRPAAVNVGYNPTFTSPRGDSPVSQSALSNSPITVEAHLLTEPGEPPLPSLYGQTLRLQFVARIRSEQKFPSVAALVEQIGNDIASVRQRLGGTP
jgi:riboflavin kinase/FMN adenylyltransferase